MLLQGLPWRELSKTFCVAPHPPSIFGVSRRCRLNIVVTFLLRKSPIDFEESSKILFSWSSYKINQVQDKVGVFVSIVSTKIPFKGTGKEYIGDDISEIATAVKVNAFSLLMQIFSWIWLVSNASMSSVCNSAVLYPAKIQNSEENASTWAAGEETKFKQVILFQ